MTLGDLFNFRKQFVKYGAYHSNKMNQQIHMVCVPLIVLASLIWLASVPLPRVNYHAVIMKLWTVSGQAPSMPTSGFLKTLIDWAHKAPPVSSSLGLSLELTAATGATFLYILYYVTLDPLTGLLIAPFLIGLNSGAHYIVTVSPTLPVSSGTIAGVLQLISWAGQIYGHQVYEGRAPALLDNAFQAFALAPLFVFVEGLFEIGYKPGFRAEVEKDVKGEIEKWKKTKTKGLNNGKASKKVSVGGDDSEEPSPRRQTPRRLVKKTA